MPTEFFHEYSQIYVWKLLAILLPDALKLIYVLVTVMFLLLAHDVRQYFVQQSRHMTNTIIKAAINQPDAGADP